MPLTPAARFRLPLLRLVVSLAVAACLLGTALPAGLPAANAALPKRSGILLGIVGDVAAAKSQTGQSFAVHRYAKFDGNVPKAKMITVRSSATWQRTANLTAGSTGYNDIVRWAKTLKERGGKTYVAFHHEPESAASSSFGTASAYKAAYRRVVTIFRNQGATNVIWVWQMTDWAFRTDPSDRQYAAKWYPGDAYVDVVGGDPYNWYNCGSGRGRWMSLKSLVDPMITFAKAHGKQAALPEFASQRNSRRATWLSDARSYLAANDQTIAAVFYYNERPMNPASQDCTWKLSTNPEWSALRSMARDTSFRS